MYPTREYAPLCLRIGPSLGKASGGYAWVDAKGIVADFLSKLAFMEPRTGLQSERDLWESSRLSVYEDSRSRGSYDPAFEFGN
jgi:hypothetical protein